MAKCALCNNTAKKGRATCSRCKRRYKKFKSGKTTKPKKTKNFEPVRVARTRIYSKAEIEAFQVKRGLIPNSQISFYASREWQELRYRALKTYGPKCMLCFATNTEMHVDHIKPRSLHPDLELDFTNLQILCRACNLGKSNLDQTDWRPKTPSSA